MSSLLQDFYILPNGIQIKNRIVKSAMTEGLAYSDQLPNSLHERLYRHWIEGGAGLLITGNVMVDPEQLERSGNIAYRPQDRNLFIQSWQRILEEARQHNTKVFMQISHPGRQCPGYICKEPWSSSSIKLDFLGNYGQPKEMSEAEIETTIERFAQLAVVAQEAGFDGVQIHAAHGYLVSSFLSPLTNKRMDRWGGTLENRSRFLLEIIRVVCERTSPQFAFSIKLNMRDFKKGGFSLGDCSELIKILNNQKLDLLEVSGGSYEQPVLLGRPYSELDEGATLKSNAYFESEAQQVRTLAKMPLMLTGGIRSSTSMQVLLNQNVCDFIGLARPFCLEPSIAKKVLAGEIVQLPEEDLQVFPKLLPHSEGQRTSTKALLNVMGSLAWYFCQVKGLATGRSRRYFGARRAFFYYVIEEQVKAIKLKIRKRLGC